MKGIVLAGGEGTRLHPLTKVTNKHLLPVGRYPMIFHPIARLAEAGLTEILIVTGTEHMEDIVKLLGSGNDWGLDFTYRVQQEAGGIAQALGLAENFVADEKCVVLLGDNIFEENISTKVDAFREQETGARLLLKEVEDPTRFGVPELDKENGRITKIVEKPETPPSTYCVTGIYMYDSQVFDFIDSVDPSDRGELEITDVNNLYIEQDCLKYDILASWWTDAGTFESYTRANQLANDITLSEFPSLSSI